MVVVSALDGMVPLEVAPPLLDHVRDSRVTGQRFPRTILHLCESKISGTIFLPRDSCPLRYWEVQVEIGEEVQGWIYWTWKVRFPLDNPSSRISKDIPWQTESADEWSYQKGLEGGWIPQDPTQRLYPGLCNGTSS